MIIGLENQFLFFLRVAVLHTFNCMKMCLCTSAECDKPGILTCENDGFIDKTCNCTCPDVVEGFRCEKIISRLMQSGNKQYFVLHI